MTFLVADIGATSARFALGDGDGLAHQVELPTADFSSARDMVAAATDALDWGALAAACLAVAGPVGGDVAKITNQDALQFSTAELADVLGCPVQVVNDFFALALAVPVVQSLERIGGGAGDGGAKALLGPGSGLGMAGLIPNNGAWSPLSSEGGHGDLAPGSPLEAELVNILRRRHGHTSWETALSGPGLVRLYQAVAEIWGVRAQSLGAPEISALGQGLDDPVCHQTLETFFALLGAAAGNLALTFCATGGVYLGGGIVPQLVTFAQSSALRRRFEERGIMTDYVAPIPLYIVLDQSPGLLGAMQCLLRPP